MVFPKGLTHKFCLKIEILVKKKTANRIFISPSRHFWNFPKGVNKLLQPKAEPGILFNTRAQLNKVIQKIYRFEVVLR